MATTITFESATIIDVIKKAARIAPGKAGSAFDQAWGVVMEIYPNQEAQCLIRATNTDVFYVEVVGCNEATGDDVMWRLPSQLLSAILAKLPIGSGKEIKFVQDGTKVAITAGRMKATLVLGDVTYYPQWDTFDDSEMSLVPELGGRIAMVEWAADTGAGPPLCGVCLDGEYVFASDRYVLARAPLKIDIPEPVLLPAGMLGTVLKAIADTRAGMSGGLFQLAPDQFTQIQTVVFDGGYPTNVRSVMRTDYPQSVQVPKTPFIDLLERASQFAGSDRMPILKLFIGRGEIAAMMENAEVGFLGDVLEIPNQAPHERKIVKVTPKFLMNALSHAPNDRVTLKYDITDPDRNLYVDGGSGYECWVMTRKDQAPTGP